MSSNAVATYSSNTSFPDQSASHQAISAANVTNTGLSISPRDQFTVNPSTSNLQPTSFPRNQFIPFSSTGISPSEANLQSRAQSQIQFVNHSWCSIANAETNLQPTTRPQRQFGYQPLAPTTTPSRGETTSLPLQYSSMVGVPLSAFSCTTPPETTSSYYAITLLQNCHSKVSVCYGCRQNLKIENQIPPPPADLVIMTKMRREYIDPQDGTPRVGKTPSNVYFHCHPDCVKKKQVYFTPHLAHIQPEVKAFLTPTHINYLYGNFGMSVL